MFCNMCGNQLVEGAAFCPKCGAKVYSEENVQYQSDMQSVNDESIDRQSDVSAPNNETMVCKLDVVLTDVGTNKVKVIKAVREWTGLGLKEAKDLVDNVPILLKNAVTQEEAEFIKDAFMRIGATVIFKDQKGSIVDVSIHCKFCGAVLDAGCNICQSCGNVYNITPPYKNNPIQDKQPFLDGINGKEIYDEYSSKFKRCFDEFKGLSNTWKVFIGLGSLFIIFIVLFLIRTVLRMVFSSVASVIIVVVGGYIVYQRWIAKYIARLIYNTKSKNLQLPEGMNAQTLLESLSGKFNYPYFNGVRYGDAGECLIDGKYSTYTVIFTESDGVCLICDPDLNDKKYYMILRENIAICKYINKFFNPTQSIDVLKDLNALKSAERQRKKSVIVLCIVMFFLIIVYAVQGGGSSAISSASKLDKSLYGRWRADDGTIIELSNDGSAQTNLKIQPFWAFGKSAAPIWSVSNGQLNLITSYDVETRYEYTQGDSNDDWSHDELFFRDLNNGGSLKYYRLDGTKGDDIIGEWVAGSDGNNPSTKPYFVFNKNGTGTLARGTVPCTWEADDEYFYMSYDLISTFDYYVQGDLLQLYFSDGSRMFTRVSN